MLTEFEMRMGVMWQHGQERVQYGVVTYCDENVVDVMRVLPLKAGLHCYDEGLNYETDRHNVRLDSVPPPFSFLCIMDCVDKCYVPAVPGTVLSFQGDEVEMLSVIDGGEKISELDFYTIFNHPWPEQKELELTMDARSKKPETDQKPAARQSAFASLMAAVNLADKTHEPDDGPDFC